LYILHHLHTGSTCTREEENGGVSRLDEEAPKTNCATANAQEADPTPMNGEFAKDDSQDVDLPPTTKEASPPHGDTDSGTNKSDRADGAPDTRNEHVTDDDTSNRGPHKNGCALRKQKREEITSQSQRDNAGSDRGKTADSTDGTASTTMDRKFDANTPHRKG
jgi:hypothetical protein